MAAFRAFWQANAPDRAAGLGPIAETRDGFEAQHGAIPVADGCRVEAVSLGGVPAERLVPAGADPGRTILYLHGGGHVFGSARSHRHMVSRLAQAAGAVAYVTDHRLAPEAPFPAALDDAGAAYEALLEAGVDRARLVVAGESAGGGLAAALVLALKTRGRPLPAALYLLSPWLDLTQSGAAHTLRAAADPLVTTASLADCAAHYLSAGGDPTDPLVSPVFGDLTGLPPSLVQVGADEVLLSDALEFVQRAALVGQGVHLQVWAEMVHAWPLFHTALGAGERALSDAGDWISRQTPPPSPESLAP